MPQVAYIPVEVLMNQYEFALCDQDVLPNAPISQRKGNPYPRIELMVERGIRQQFCCCLLKLWTFQRAFLRNMLLYHRAAEDSYRALIASTCNIDPQLFYFLSIYACRLSNPDVYYLQKLTFWIEALLQSFLLHGQLFYFAHEEGKVYIALPSFLFLKKPFYQNSKFCGQL